SIIPTYRRLGMEALGEQMVGNDFNWPAVFKGFETLSAMPYPQAYGELARTPDGSPQTSAAGEQLGRATPTNLQGAPATVPSTQHALTAHAAGGDAHPVSCVDCHDPDNMELRVTRP